MFEPCKLVFNVITVSDGLHPLINTYGAFAYVPSDTTMDALLAIVKSRNEVLQQAINELDPWTSRKSRNLIVCCYFLFKIRLGALNVKPGIDQPSALEHIYL